ncbi:MAG: histidine phosphatase family protein [Promethearchaeota archaeon]|nr:MAG: histidine phosphatase family protein [Candidatus Lokiarchaeota archaeon]
MSNNTIIFLRHAETKIDKNIMVSHWKLTEKGKIEASHISKLDLFKDLDLIISSNEEKAFMTAIPFSERLHKEIIRDESLNEINRDKGNYINTNQEYLKILKLCLAYRNKSFNYWETVNNALKRFSKKIQDFDLKYTNKKILIVSHGVVINLYFAKVLGKLDNVFDRWSTNTFCDYGIIRDGKVLKDIAQF